MSVSVSVKVTSSLICSATVAGEIYIYLIGAECLSKLDRLLPALPTHLAIATWQRQQLKADFNHN